MPRLALAAAFLALGPAAAPAQPKPIVSHLDRLPLGTLYVGAVAEASFRVVVPGSDPKTKFEVTTPKFVKVLKTDTVHQRFGADDYLTGSVWLSVDTAAAGDLTGEVTATLGKTTIKVPVTATVKARRPGLTRVLVVGTPFDRHSTPDSKAFAAWTDLARDAGLDPSYLLVDLGGPVLRDFDLSAFDCILLPACGLVQQTPADVKRVRAYAEAGGRVVVTANHFYQGSVKQANAVLDGYGLEVRDMEAGKVGGMKDVTLGKEDFAPDVVRAGVASARFFRASPVAVTDPKAGRVVAKAVGVGGPGDGFAAMAKAGKGEVVALGDSLWWNWVSKEWSKGTDNAKLLRWLLTLPRPG
jgi:hypothetical protein